MICLGLGLLEGPADGPEEGPEIGVLLGLLAGKNNQQKRQKAAKRLEEIRLTTLGCPKKTLQIYNLPGLFFHFPQVSGMVFRISILNGSYFMVLWTDLYRKDIGQNSWYSSSSQISGRTRHWIEPEREKKEAMRAKKTHLEDLVVYCINVFSNIYLNLTAETKCRTSPFSIETGQPARYLMSNQEAVAVATAWEKAETAAGALAALALAETEGISTD